MPPGDGCAERGDEMTNIQNTRELPTCDLRAYQVHDEAEAQQIADGRTAYLFQQTAKVLYLFVEIGKDE